MGTLLSFLLISSIIVLLFFRVSAGADSITKFQSLSDGNTLISKNGNFELGFFSPGKVRDRYLGIWYKNMTHKTVVWTANKQKPIKNFSGVLRINGVENNKVVLFSRNNTVVWSISPRRKAQNPVLQLMDSGKIVLREQNDENLENILWQVTVRKNQNPGNNSSAMDIDSYCDNYGVCGPNGNCDLNKAPACVCLNGFSPRSSKGWELLDHTQGCVRNKPLDCRTDGFIKYTMFKVPNGTYSWLNQSLTGNDCRTRCLSNCSCVGYINSDIGGAGIGCTLWFGDLFDVRVVTEGGHDLYIRMSASELATEEGNQGHQRKIVGIIVGSAIAVTSVFLLVFYFFCKRRKNFTENKKLAANVDHINEEQKEDLELPLLDLSRVASATDNFSAKNKLGEGGFGPVYKGILDDGQEIAVKKLSSSSGQGLNELKNEVKLIAKLQHRNLVKLLGCCIQDEEKLLIYEYMPNKSLDYFIFDETRRKLLDWSQRFNIISGIARGLLYLHQDSRLRIIHRDLKASNVLLDNVMNPKISDFGLARSFIGDQSINTQRVVGTYGYMAPEYAIHGCFSVKSDVFSFGILLLEIVSGKKNKGFIYPNGINLIGHTWDLWQQGRSLELIDECLRDSCNVPQVLRCIHISLLCVQQHPQDRPSMSSVVLMLSSEISLPQPQLSSFFIVEHIDNGNSSSCTNDLSITELEAR